MEQNPAGWLLPPCFYGKCEIGQTIAEKGNLPDVPVSHCQDTAHLLKKLSRDPKTIECPMQEVAQFIVAIQLESEVAHA